MHGPAFERDLELERDDLNKWSLLHELAVSYAIGGHDGDDRNGPDGRA